LNGGERTLNTNVRFATEATEFTDSHARVKASASAFGRTDARKTRIVGGSFSRDPAAQLT
jgi:hypothetical protein